MNSATFLMTNMVPQLHALNAGPWEALESQERQFVAAATREAYIVAGPIFGPSPTRIGPGVEVPSADFKIIVLVEAGADPRMLDGSGTSYAVIMPHSVAVTGKPWVDYLATIDEVEKQTGYDFLTALTVEVQAAPTPWTVTGLTTRWSVSHDRTCGLHTRASGDHGGSRARPSGL